MATIHFHWNGKDKQTLGATISQYRSAVSGFFDTATHKAMLEDGVISSAELAWAAADTPLNAANIDLVGLTQTGLDHIPWQA